MKLNKIQIPFVAKKFPKQVDFGCDLSLKILKEYNDFFNGEYGIEIDIDKHYFDCFLCGFSVTDKSENYFNRDTSCPRCKVKYKYDDMFCVYYFNNNDGID